METLAPGRRAGTGLLCLALATLALLFAAGHAAALPTKLCKANEASCSKANTWTLAPENFKGTISTMKLVLPGYLTVSCNPGKFASTLAEGAGPLTGEVFKWNFFNCTPEGCGISTPATEGTGFSAEVEATGGGNGTMKVGKAPTLVLTCSAPAITCVYSAASIQLSVQGGGVGVAAISTESQLNKDFFKSSLNCTQTAIYAAKHLIVEPGLPVYVTN
ncbi:MAG TPA: hypothetical protein VF125_03655 [Solirubrobacterales bacterium]